MARDTTKNGKAFEYACLEALRVEFSRSQRVCVLDSEQLHTAERCYLSLKSSVRSEMCKAASAMKRVLVRLEPKLRNCRDGDVLSLSLQSDERVSPAMFEMFFACVYQTNGKSAFHANTTTLR